MEKYRWNKLKLEILIYVVISNASVLKNKLTIDGVWPEDEENYATDFLKI